MPYVSPDEIDWSKLSPEEAQEYEEYLQRVFISQVKARKKSGYGGELLCDECPTGEDTCPFDSCQFR